MKIIDLTLTISQTIPTFSGSPRPRFISWSQIKKDGYNLELLFFSSHTGTHLDAPYHFNENGMKIHEIPPERLISDAILIRTKKEKNQSIQKSDITKFEKTYGKIQNKSTVIFFTGWQKNLKKSNYFTKNPGLSASAVTYLISKNTNLVGIDSPSIDSGKNKNFPAHKILSKRNILIAENLKNLDKISTSNFKLIILPLKLQNATGSPVRAIAFQNTN
ncbi:MAG: cyclase family protein [Thaumarchaeota archaeon]|nr:cyclase family protein [Nitrososphaerota archaeon]